MDWKDCVHLTCMIQANLLVIYYLSVHQLLHPSIHFFCPFVHPATIQPFLQSSSHLTTTTHFIYSIYKIQIEHLLADFLYSELQCK